MFEEIGNFLSGIFGGGGGGGDIPASFASGMAEGGGGYFPGYASPAMYGVDAGLVPSGVNDIFSAYAAPQYDLPQGAVPEQMYGLTGGSFGGSMGDVSATTAAADYGTGGQGYGGGIGEFLRSLGFGGNPSSAVAASAGQTGGQEGYAGPDPAGYWPQSAQGPGYFPAAAPTGAGWGKELMGNIREYAPLVGLGATAAGVLNQLTRPGGVEALTPLQQQQLSMAQKNQAMAQQYMTGTLTPEMEISVNAQAAANKAAIRSKYAQFGMTGSTPERQALASADQSRAVAVANLQAQMIRTGAQMMGLPTNMIASIANQQAGQDAAFANALARFAAAATGMPQERKAA